MGAFDATGTPPTRPEVALAGFNSTYVEASNTSPAFAGYSIGNTHYQDSPTESTSSIVVSPAAHERVILISVVAHSSQNTVQTPFFGTLAEEGSDDDLVVYQATAYGNFLATNLNIPLEKGKDLIHYRVQGKAGTGDINAITVMYKIVAG